MIKLNIRKKKKKKMMMKIMMKIKKNLMIHLMIKTKKIKITTGIKTRTTKIKIITKKTKIIRTITKRNQMIPQVILKQIKIQIMIKTAINLILVTILEATRILMNNQKRVILISQYNPFLIYNR